VPPFFIRKIIPTEEVVEMKKVLGLVLVMMVLVVMVSGAKIGITAIVEHPALDAVRDGILDRLAELGYVQGENLDVMVQTAQGNMTNAVSIASHFVSEKPDVVVGISTPSAQALANATDKIPVVFSAVTDPVAAGLVPQMGLNAGNVVGISDMTPVKTQLKLILYLLPNVKKIGILTNPGETNSTVLTQHAKVACEELGLELVEIVGTTTAEMIASMSALAPSVDAVYAGTDNTAASCMSSLQQIALKNGIAIMAGDISMARSGGLIGFGFDYYRMGLETGNMVAQLLEGKKPEELESRMVKADSLQLYLDLDIAAQLGIEVPEALLEQADFIVENGEESGGEKAE